MKYSKTLVFLTLIVLIVGVPSAFAAGDLFFTTGGQPRFFGGPTLPGQIQQVRTDGTGQTVIIADTLAATGAIRPHGIAVDLVSGKIFWTNWRTPGPAVSFSDLDGTNAGSFSPFTPFFHTGIAVDGANGRLYALHAFRFVSANLDGTGVIDLLEPFGNQVGEVELDLANGHVYWTQRDRIRRANLDGTGIVDILNISQPRGIEIDAANNTIYFTTNARNTLYHKAATCRLEWRESGDLAQRGYRFFAGSGYYELLRGSRARSDRQPALLHGYDRWNH